jgi:flagellin-like hook-associated protein FlgL
MKTQAIALNQALYNYGRTMKTMDALTQKLSTGKKISAPKDDPVGWANARRSRSTFQSLQAVNDSLNMVAMSIRTADNAMESIGKLIDQMKAQLEVIVKNYPPFPPGSEDRVKLLNSFNMLKRQIDQLTIPPNNRGVWKILSDPASNPEAGDWNILTGPNGEQRTIHNEQVNTGPTGLNIPEMSANATDQQISSMIDTIETAKSTLTNRRNSLAMDATGLTSAQDYNSKIAALNQSYADSLELGDMTETTAELQSIQVKQTLNIEAIKSITGAQSQLAALWK